MKKQNRIRDLKKDETWDEQPSFLTIEEHNQRVRLAHWYMRKAGIDPNKPVIEKENTTWITRIRWLFFGLAVATVYIMAANVFGK